VTLNKTSRYLSLPLFLVLLAALWPQSSCRSSALGPAKARRLILVSFDGLGEKLLEDWLETPGITSEHGLAGMAHRGLKAERVRMVNPTLTAVNHASLITGALPSDTGIISNSFHVPGDPITRRHSGFSAPNEAETLWTRARKAGIRTGVLLWPGADGSTKERSGDFGLVWPDRPLIFPAIHDLDPAQAEPEKGVKSEDGLETISWTLKIGHQPSLLSLKVAVFDGNPDGHAAFDSIGIRSNEGWSTLTTREWFELRPRLELKNSGEKLSTSGWSRVLHLDRETGALRIYTGEFNTLSAYPEDFRSRVLEIAGAWPGTPDGKNLASWWLDDSTGIDLDTYIEQVERLDRYLDTIASWVMKNEDFGLLIAYHPSPDEYEHAGLIVEDQQWAYSPATAFAAEKAMERVGRSADRSTANLFEGIDKLKDTLVVVSDHGHLPIHDEVLINRALADAGLVKTTEKHGREYIAKDSPMAAYTAGGCANIYLNLVGREENGVIARAEADDLLRRAARALADLSVKGEPVVDKVFSRTELPPLGLDHPNSGDLVVFLKPGYTATSRMDGPAIRPSKFYGQHGYLNHYDELCGIFMARGGPVRPGEISEIKSIDIAGRISRWLGLP